MKENNKKYATFPLREETFELKLAPRELIIYTIIASYSSGGRGVYFGTVKYLAEAISASERTAHRVLGSLTERGLIEKCIHNNKSAIRCRRVDGEALIRDKDSEKATFTSPEAEDAPCGLDGTSSAELLPPTYVSPEWESQSARFAEEDAAWSKESCTLRDQCSALGCSLCMRGDMFDSSWRESYEAVGLNPKFKPYSDKPRYELMSFGNDGAVALTWEQYNELRKLLPSEDLHAYFIRLENFIKHLPTSSPFPHSHYHTLKKWITKDNSI